MRPRMWSVERRVLEQPGVLPLPDHRLADRRHRAHLAGDGEDDWVGPLLVVALRADEALASGSGQRVSRSHYRVFEMKASMVRMTACWSRLESCSIA